MMIRCACPDCMSEGTIKTDLFRRGGRAAYLCEYHFREMRGYSEENHKRVGTDDKVTEFTFSFENETSASTEKARVELYNEHFMPSRDGTVDVEYKSPIYYGMNAMSKHAATIQHLIDDGELEINWRCGTHVHVGHKSMINAVTMSYIRRFYHSLFLPLSDEMSNNPEAVERLFGRPLNSWAEPIEADTDPERHTNFANTQHDWTLEWRVCKFVNNKQFMSAAKCCADMTGAIITNFLAHFNDEPTDKRRYPTIREYRKHKADVTAQKMVKIFRKYAGI